jgi:hypothetical protein
VAPANLIRLAFANANERLLLLFPPPLWGRVREGGRAALESVFLQARPQFNQLQSDRFQYAVDIVKNFVIGESQNRIALGVQCSGARGIPRDFRIGRMCRAVDLDNQARLKAGEVCDEAVEDDLTSKPEASDLFPSNAIP